MTEGPNFSTETPPTDSDPALPRDGLASVIRPMEAFLEALPDEAWLKDARGRYVIVNECYARTLGRSPEEIVGRTDEEIFPAEIAAEFHEADRRMLEVGERAIREHWGAGPQDQDRRYETIRSPVHDDEGEVVGLVAIARDVTERYRREEELRAAERHYRRLTETSPDGIFVTDLEGRVREANPALCRILGRAVEDVEGRLFLEFVTPGSREEILDRFGHRHEGKSVSDVELWIGRPSGERRRIQARSTLIEEEGRVTGSHGVVRDVTEERRREEAERRMIDVLDATPDIVAIRDADGGLLYTNKAGRDWRAWAGPAGGLEDWDDVLSGSHPEWAAELVEKVGIPVAMSDGSWTGETAIRGQDGGEIPISQVIVAGRDENGEVSHVSTIMRDIRTIKVREKALERRDAILEAVSQTGTEFLRTADWRKGADVGLARLGAATDVSRVSVLRLDRQEDDSYTASLVLEWTADGIPAMLDDPLLQDVPAEEAGMSRWVEHFERGRSVYGPVSELPHREREILQEQEIRSVAAVPIDVRGGLWGMIVFDDCIRRREWEATEIEALRAAAGALGAAIQRRETEEELSEREEELRQSQKMEAIGRLAGGVAHDFNNMLTAIQGFATVLQDEVDGTRPGQEYLDEILRAAERSAALTRQLLAFSRKQVMRPKVMVLNEIIADMESMLRRLLGETITLTTDLAEDLHAVKVDPGQMEQVIMNLCVNARDAMPTGGALEVGTRNVHVDGQGMGTHDGSLEPGDYVVVRVADSGVGLDPEISDRIFEPFFTTKDMGEGTGLGLATVYGIVTQSGGGIAVESEPGAGTTFRIYLPRCDGSVEVEPETEGERETTTPSPGGFETILVVEDEVAVRRLIKSVLERDGYTVLTAGTGLETLSLLRSHDGPIHLLLTDVVMPEMGGPELARILREDQPGLRVCFMSGYTEDEVFRHGVETRGQTFLEKPFTPTELKDRVAAMLSSDTGDLGEAGGTGDTG